MKFYNTIDFYITKKFLGTFFYAIGLILSIAIVFDISENLDEFISKEIPIRDIVFDYYLNFIPYFGNLFSPLFTFIAVIYFTSKMAFKTMINSGLSKEKRKNKALVDKISATLILQSYLYSK